MAGRGQRGLRYRRQRAKMEVLSENRWEARMLMFCIRHGESTYNAQGRVQGHLNIPLSELGRRQAAALAEVCRGWRRGDLLQSLAACPRDGRTDRRGPGPSDPRRAPPDRNQGWHLSRPQPRRVGSDLSAGVCPLAERRCGLCGARRRVAPCADAAWRRGPESIAECDYRRVIVVSHGAILAAAFKSLLEIPAERHPSCWRTRRFHGWRSKIRSSDSRRSTKLDI